jgi:tetratricopeptide (TPR) repeat protein
VARNQLAIEKEFPRAPRTFVSGQYRDVDEPRRQELAALAAETNDIDKVFDALVQTNRDVASSNNKVSSSCFTTCLSRTGDGVGKPYDMIIPADLDLFRGGSDVRRPGPDLRGKSLKGYVFANVGRTSEAEYHSIHLEDKPDAPGTHINYGVFLEKGGDIDGSERAFRKALSVDPLNVTALANLANVLDRAGSSDEADALFRQTLEISPGLEYASYRYANFLWRKGTDSARIRGIIEEGIRLNPQSGRLLLLLGNIEMRESRGKPALAAFQRARELGAEQAAVETGCAFALHISGAPIADCIAAYRTAIALDSMNAALTLNMAQLLFAAGLDDQAQPTLRRAMRLELDPPSQLEAQFYLLAHMQADPVSAVSKMRGLLQAGARLTWSMDVTLERVNAINPNRAKLLKQLRGVLAGNEPVSKLAVLAPQLSSML